MRLCRLRLEILNICKLAGAISEVSWYEFRRMLEYKASWYGRIISIRQGFIRKFLVK